MKKMIKTPSCAAIRAVDPKNTTELYERTSGLTKSEHSSCVCLEFGAVESRLIPKRREKMEENAPTIQSAIGNVGCFVATQRKNDLIKWGLRTMNKGTTREL